MNRLSVLSRMALLLIFCACISGCKGTDINKLSEDFTEDMQITPSLQPTHIIPSTETEGNNIPLITEEPTMPVIKEEPAVTEIGHVEKGLVKFVKGNSINVRETPGLDSHIILQLNSATEVELVESEGSWSRIIYNDIIGYIHNDYLSDTAVVQDTATAASTTENTMQDRLNSPFIKVKKSERILELWDGDSLFASYPIGLGWEPEGDKKKEGDGRTPEGNYYVCTRNSNSRFYLSLGVSYPNVSDAKEGLDNGLINRSTYEEIVNAIDRKACPPWNTALGGEIMIHGMGSSSDWTAGCIAVDNDVMDILWKYCPMRTPITIEP